MIITRISRLVEDDGEQWIWEDNVIKWKDDNSAKAFMFDLLMSDAEGTTPEIRMISDDEYYIVM